MIQAYRIKRRDIFLGKELKHGEAGTNSFIRLAKKDAGTWKRPVHEVWDVKGETGMLTNPVEHSATKNITDFVEKLNHYTTMNAEHLYKTGEKSSFWQILLYPVGKFLNNYIVKKGFLDGTHGFIHAVFMSFHSFLTRGKLYLLWNKKPVT